jgi:hypothetical protein
VSESKAAEGKCMTSLGMGTMYSVAPKLYKQGENYHKTAYHALMPIFETPLFNTSKWWPCKLLRCEHH